MSRALQGSCDLGPVVEVWFPLVLKYLWHCLPWFQGIYCGASTDQDSKDMARKSKKRLTKCLLQWGFVRKSTFVEQRSDSKFYKWFWSNRSVCSWEWRESRDGEMDPKKKENKAIVYYTSWWTNELYADLIDSFRGAWDSGNDQWPRRCQWNNLC